MSRYDLYQEITDRILAQLKEGVVPWVQPWKNGVGGAHRGMPYNVVSGKNYSGINILLLWGTPFSSNGWLTYKQALSLGGNVKKGEKGTHIVFASKFLVKAKKGSDEDDKSIFFLKSYTVFNRDQCENLPAEDDIAEPLVGAALNSAADELIAKTGAMINIGGDKAFYAPSRDCIVIPPAKAYDPEPINWYRTAFHELGHWTGAEHRLNRNIKNKFGNQDYAREELVAEMSAAFTCASLGIEPTVRHADYIGSWIKCLQDDPKAVVQAASQASKATDYILNHLEEIETDLEQAA